MGVGNKVYGLHQILLGALAAFLPAELLGANAVSLHLGAGGRTAEHALVSVGLLSRIQHWSP